MKRSSVLCLVLTLMMLLSVLSAGSTVALAESSPMDAAAWLSAYSGILDEMNTAAQADTSNNPANVYDYLLYDIDENGTPELITKTGTCEADYTGTVYFIKAGSAMKAGDFGLGHACLYTDPGMNGVIVWWAHQGAAGAARYSLLNGKLVSEEVFDEQLDIQNNPNAEYTPVEEQVPGAKAMAFYPTAQWMNTVPYDGQPLMSAESGTLSTAASETQLSLIYAGLDLFRQDESQYDWYYTVTDLDHNGRLELLTASTHHADRSTDLKAWEVNETGAFFAECCVWNDADESFPDIIAENADTYYDADTDSWYYMFYDNIWLSDSEAYAIKTSVMMKDEVFGYEEYALQHVEGPNQVSYLDTDGNAISADDYNTAGETIFTGKVKSSTNFDWFRISDVKTASRLDHSYAVFNSEKQPAKQPIVPTPKPAPKPTPRPTPVPPAPQPTFLMITKNPTSESHDEGETAWFVAGANVWDYLEWTFIGSNGVRYSVSDFRNYYPNCPVNGENTPSLSIDNVSDALDGWSVYCTFYYGGQTAKTNTAYLYVQSNPTPPPPQEIDGTVIDGTTNFVTIALDNGQTVQVSTQICESDNGITIGCGCNVYYEGYSPDEDNITYVYVYSSGPQPVYGEIGGTVVDGTTNFVTIALDNGQTVQVSTQICDSDDGIVIGCYCDVYYYGYSPDEGSITSVHVYSSGPQPPEPPDPPEPPEPPQPTYGSESGTIWGLAQGQVMIDLNSGGSVTVSQGICNSSSGSIREGDQCTVNYYGDVPSSDNIYSVDVYDWDDDQDQDQDEEPVEWQDWDNDQEPVEWQDWDDDQEPVEWQDQGLGVSEG